MWNSRFLSAWQDRYRSLQRREQLVLTAGGVAVLAFFLVQFLFFPTSDRLDQLKNSVKARESELSELRAITAQYRLLEGAKGESILRTETFNLFALLEKVATQGGLMDKIEYMKPGTSQIDAQREERWVEARLTKMTLKDLTGYLYNLHASGKEIYMKRLSARKDGEYLTVIMQPAVMETKNPGA